MLTQPFLDQFRSFVWGVAPAFLGQKQVKIGVSGQYASSILRAEATHVHAQKHTDSINTDKVLTNFNYKYTH